MHCETATATLEFLDPSACQFSSVESSLSNLCRHPQVLLTTTHSPPDIQFIKVGITRHSLQRSHTSQQSIIAEFTVMIKEHGLRSSGWSCMESSRSLGWSLLDTGSILRRFRTVDISSEILHSDLAGKTHRRHFRWIIMIACYDR